MPDFEAFTPDENKKPKIENRIKAQAKKSVKPAASTTPRSTTEAVKQTASTTPRSTSEVVEQTASATPYGTTEAVKQTASATPLRQSKSVKPATSTGADECHTEQKSTHSKATSAAEKPCHPQKENSDAAPRVFYCFILSSFIFALVVIPTRVIFDEGYRASTEYRLILFQLTAGLVFLRLPRILSRPLGIDIPHGLYIAYMLFLWAAIFLGEFALFYYRVPFWDTVMHLFSAVLLTLLGLSLPTLITGKGIPPILTALLALGFSVLIGVLWEVYEFSFDGILGLNMQKFATLTHGGLSPLTGRAALIDTMTDLIVDLIGSLVPSVAAGIYIRKNGRLPHALTVSRGK